MTFRKGSELKLGRFLQNKKASVKSNGEKIVVTKGDVVKTVDLSDLRDRIKRLRDNQALDVKKITGQIKDDFNTLTSHVGLLYDTDEYKTLFAEVKKVFGDLTSVKPGTIGAYCAGCILNSPEKGCSIICNGALPLPKNENGWQFCNYPVIWATFENGKYKFTNMNTSRGKECVIYMETPEAFGFSPEEKSQLKSMGIAKAQLVHAPLDGKEYKNINTEFLELEKLPVRGASPVPVPVVAPVAQKAASPVPAAPVVAAPAASHRIPRSEEKSAPAAAPAPVTKAVETKKRDTVVIVEESNNAIWVLLLVLVALLILFFAMKMYKA